jgi:hypothetical protein
MVFQNPRYLPGNNIVTWQGWVGDATVGFVDVQRTLDFVDESIRAVLADPAVTGNVKVNRDGLEVIYNKLWTLLKSLFGQGAIEDPEALPITNEGQLAVDIPVLQSLRKLPDARTKDEQDEINTAGSTRQLEGFVNYDYQGAVHTYNFFLTAT